MLQFTREVAAAFNEWQRQYIEDSAAFEAQWRTITRSVEEVARGEEPSYGQACCAYLKSIMEDLEARGDPLRPPPLK